MKKSNSSFWLLLTIFLTAIFVVLFYPAAKERVGNDEAILYTIVGSLVIWIVFFARKRIFPKTRN